MNNAPHNVTANFDAWDTAANSLIHFAGFRDLTRAAIHRGDGLNGGDCDLVIYVGTGLPDMPVTDDAGTVADPGDTLVIIGRKRSHFTRIVRTSKMIYATDIERALRNAVDDIGSVLSSTPA